MMSDPKPEETDESDWHLREPEAVEDIRDRPETYMEALMETIEILSDLETMAAIAEGLAELEGEEEE